MESHSGKTEFEQPVKDRGGEGIIKEKLGPFGPFFNLTGELEGCV